MTQIKEYILTVKAFHEEKTKEKGSVFIGQVHPVKNDYEFSQILNEVKKKYFDATHHCYAYKLADDTFKYSDAGEPNGTAGIRILNAIEHFKLSNVAVVVIRFYGGTKLGAGPLGKAYYTSALETLDKSVRIKLHSFYRINFQVGFDEVSHPHRILANVNAEINEIKYGETVWFDCFIKPDLINDFAKKLSDSLNRKIELTKDDNLFFR